MVRLSTKYGRKDTYITKFFEVLKEYEPLTDQLFALIDKGIVNGGCYYLYAHTQSHHHNWFFGWLESNKVRKYSEEGKSLTKLWDYDYHLKGLIEDLEKTKAFLANDYQRGYRQWHLDNDQSETWKRIREELKNGQIL